MPHTTPIPWDGLGIIALTVIAIFVSVAVIVALVSWVDGARNALRHRYLGPKRTPQWMDLLALPAWIALELLCLVFLLTVGLLTVLLAYQAARDVRDWWHEGGKR